MCLLKNINLRCHHDEALKCVYNIFFIALFFVLKMEFFQSKRHSYIFVMCVQKKKKKSKEDGKNPLVDVYSNHVY